MKQQPAKILIFIPAVLLLLVIAALLIPDELIETFSSKIGPTGSIIIFVEDGNTKKPLQNATVAIPETGQTWLTDENGKTSTIKVPIVEDTSYKSIMPKPWSEITLLVYKQGYVECAIFHVNIWENQTRNGPTILLFPVTAGESNDPFTLTEGPNRLWVKQLLDKYKP